MLKSEEGGVVARVGWGGVTEESACWNENGKLIFFSSLENMMNGDMRKAHYVHDDERKNAFGCFKGIKSKRSEKTRDQKETLFLVFY